MFKKIALLSVFHKDGIIEFAERLKKLGFTLIASGGTCRHLREAGLEVINIADIVGFPAVLDHRVVTLSHKTHAGLLAKHSPEHKKDMVEIGAVYIDLVCVDLYPLEQVIADPKSDLTKIIETIDIGGPTILSSASKGQRIVICDPVDREFVLSRLESDGQLTMTDIEMLAAKADKVVAAYRLLSARYRSNGQYHGFIGKRVLTCKYGENAWQTPASLYSCETNDPLALDKFKVIAGTAPSYNNLCDVDRLLQTITHIAAGFHLNFGEVPLCGIAVKHGNACGASTEKPEVVGAAVGDEPCEILKRIVTGDTRAIFGGLVMVNFGIDVNEADILLTHAIEGKGRRLLDGIIAPFFSDEAIAMLKRKKDKCRFLANEALQELNIDSLDSALRLRYVRGGFLTQPNYTYIFNFKHPDLEIRGQLTHQQKINLILGWAINTTSNSNTITLIRDNMLIGNGCGQQDRVSAAKLAINKANDAGHKTKKAVAISDSFFPFDDGAKVLCDAGCNAILTTSGSVQDKNVQQTIEAADVTLLWVPDKVGRGFFGH